MSEKEPQQASDFDLVRNDVVTIEGVDYKVKRLGIRHCFIIGNLLKDIYINGRDDVMIKMPDVFSQVVTIPLNDAKGNPTGETTDVVVNKDPIATILGFGLLYSEKKIYELFAYLIGVSEEELQDPEKFPMDCFVTLSETLVNHRDFTAFLARMNQTASGLVSQTKDLLVSSAAPVN